MRKILFSPVGGTDPISLNNECDGSLLHICRFYKPEVVYLYMSKEILDNHNADNRYLYCLDKLSDKISHKMEYIIIERPELVDVQDYQIIYGDFIKIIGNIRNEITDEDELLLNVSSGTPAMKSALMTINVLGEYKFKAIQVKTPLKCMNEHNHEGYCVELLWEFNKDNTDKTENRCMEIECPALLEQKMREVVIKHIDAYDYSAALDTLGGIQNHYYKYIQLAHYRFLLDFTNVDRLEKELNISVTPVKDGNKRKYLEYMLTIIIKKEKKLYIDFIRAITPLICDLFKLVLKDNFKINIDDYIYKNKWNKSALELVKTDGYNLNDILSKAFGGNDRKFSYGFVQSVHLMEIIRALSKDVVLIKLVEELRSVEEKIRNKAAHEIILVDEEIIKSETKFSSDEIIKKLKKLFAYTKINVKTEYWDSYDDMNKLIKEQIKKE